MLAPFVVGGLAAAWLAITSSSALLVAIGWASSVLAAGAIVLLVTAAPAERRQRGRLAKADRRAERWPARPVWSSVVRGVTVFAPVGVSVSAALAVQEVLPPPSGGWNSVGHVAILLICGLGVLYPAEQATRRLAPITMLLKLSLAFPSAAPSRFRVARRSGNVGVLRKALEAGHAPDDPARTEVAGTLLALVAALTAHDSRTRGHSERVRVFTEMLAAELGVEDRSRERLRWSALLHDIGKMAVSAEVLNKPGPLDEDQWTAVRRHPAVGADLVAPLAPWLGEWGAAVAEHHERLDGSGYPHGLERDQISLGARIIAVADAFDTMVTPRPYRAAMSPGAAREEVARFSASQFDPRVVRALMSLSIPRLWWRIGLAAWLAHLPLLRRGGPGRSKRAAARNPLPIAGMLSMLAAVVVLSASGLLGNQPSIPGVDSGGGMPSELDSSASGRITVGPAPAPATGPAFSGLLEEGGAATDVLSEGAEGTPADGSGLDGGGGAQAGQGAGGGQGDQGAGQGGQGSGGAAGDSGGGAGDGAVGGQGTVVEANEDVIVPGTGAETGTEEPDQPVGGAGTPPPGPPATTPPQAPPPSPQPPAGDDGSGGDGEDDGPKGHGHGYGHDKGRGQGHENHDDD
jgi:putative nucleotidyltransferase with HDIG domain